MGSGRQWICAECPLKNKIESLNDERIGFLYFVVSKRKRLSSFFILFWHVAWNFTHKIYNFWPMNCNYLDTMLYLK